MPTTVMVVAVVSSISALVSRALPLSNLIDLLIAVSSPYVLIAALAASVVAALRLRGPFSIIAVVAIVAISSMQVSWYYFPHSLSVGKHFDIRVLSLNLRKGQADPASVVNLARGSADILTVSELTPEAVPKFAASGLDNTFPYSIVSPKPGTEGVGLWSRFPFADTWHRPLYTVAVAVRLRIPGVHVGPIVASLHIVSPLAREFTFDDWQREINRVGNLLRNFAYRAKTGGVIIAGDFNSTPDMRQFRDLLTNGYRDSVQQTGSGWGPTFPSGSWYPPLITIDHVLTRQASAKSVETFLVPGSDHRAVRATIKVPLGSE